MGFGTRAKKIALGLLIIIGLAFHLYRMQTFNHSVYLPIINGRTFEKQLLDLINRERAAHGLPLVFQSDLLMQAAEMHSQDMINRNFINHINPDGLGPGNRLDAIGYQWSSWAEIIEAGYPDPTTTFNSWMNSPLHRAYILDPSYGEIGIGYVAGGMYNHYWTAIFTQP